MKRKVVVIASILVLLTMGMLTLSIMTVPDEDIDSTEPLESEAGEHEEEYFESDRSEELIEDAEENEEEQGNQFSEFIAEAVETTINFFKRDETHIVAIGDSLTQGVGDSTGQGGYVGLIEKQLNQSSERVYFENFGKRGNRTDQLINRLEEPEINEAIQRADIVLITIGANDIMEVAKENFTNLTYEVFSDELIHYEERLTTIFEQIKDVNDDVEIYLIGFYNPFSQYFPEIEELNRIVDDWNHTGEKLVEDHADGTFIPTKDLFIEAEVNLFADDNFHPNEIGYELMAERVLEYLLEER